MSARTPLARRVVAALLMVLLTACHSWHPITVSPQGWTPEDQPSSVRVTLMDDETVTIDNPTMRNDSIVGATDAGRALTRRGVEVASRDVRLLEVRHFSVAKSVLMSAAVGAAVAAFVSFAPYFDSDFGPD